jgi:hypothetical protein
LFEQAARARPIARAISALLKVMVHFLVVSLATRNCAPIT